MNNDIKDILKEYDECFDLITKQKGKLYVVDFCYKKKKDVIESIFISLIYLFFLLNYFFVKKDKIDPYFFSLILSIIPLIVTFSLKFIYNQKLTKLELLKISFDKFESDLNKRESRLLTFKEFNINEEKSYLTSLKSDIVSSSKELEKDFKKSIKTSKQINNK